MKKLGFIGGGNMAEALARGLLAQRIFEFSDLIASDIDAERRRKLGRELRINTTADNAEVVGEARAIVIAVKPQTMDEVLTGLGAALKDAKPTLPAVGGKIRAAKSESSAGTGRLFISIAAGVPIARIEAPLGEAARVIRVMPNAPAMVGHGMAALVAGKSANKADMAFALRIFRAVGDAVELENERDLDAVTALSGSGPAYVYLFVKALSDAAVNEGLAPDLALRMALQTIHGAEENMRQSGRTPAELIRIVASPGGTTEAALRTFAEAGFSDIVAAAVHAAAARSRELGRAG
jgi:pyrroline-5-carboxylate reductase